MDAPELTRSPSRTAVVVGGVLLSRGILTGMDPDEELLVAIHAELQARLAVAFDAMLEEEFAGPCDWTGIVGGGTLGP